MEESVSISTNSTMPLLLQIILRAEKVKISEPVVKVSETSKSVALTLFPGHFSEQSIVIWDCLSSHT